MQQGPYITRLYYEKRGQGGDYLPYIRQAGRVRVTLIVCFRTNVFMSSLSLSVHMCASVFV